jgi:hypothetical protein
MKNKMSTRAEKSKNALFTLIIHIIRVLQGFCFFQICIYCPVILLFERLFAILPKLFNMLRKEGK